VGAELFSRAWVADDPRSADGAGLGSDANAESCVACHSQGGVGGSGGRERNVQTAGDLANVFGGMQAMMVPVTMRSPTLGSARNPPALFGSGLIDQVSAETLHALAANADPERPEISGRVSETVDGQVGRFAWKGHVPSLDDFVAQACEVELDLVIEHPTRDEHAVGVDLRAADVAALTAFVGALDAPVEIDDERRGEAVFNDVGCASCHVESVGPAQRVFSDLLLHDMGAGLSDAGFGYAEVAPSELVALAQEWRTPPLWGVRDSAPYLHDGRADTLEEAIALHGGEAETVVAAWNELAEEDRTAMDRFLRSLAAPGDEEPRR